MEWNKATVRTTQEGCEAVCAVLMEAGIVGMEIDDPLQKKHYFETPSETWDYVEEGLLKITDEDVKVIFYISANPYGDELLLAVREGIARLKASDSGLDLGSLEIETENDLDDERWLNKWKEYYKPFNMGEKLLIKPIWEDAPKTDRTVLTINPGNLFGTGLHQTTALCLETIEKYVKPGFKVLDLGCGSGILSIASLLLGAESAFACDIDENAETAAYENAANNGIGKDRYYVTSGNILSDDELIEKIGTDKYDLVLANIVADIIIEIAPKAYAQLKSGGIFISSGIIKDRLDEVKRAIKAQGFNILKTRIKDEWCSITARKE